MKEKTKQNSGFTLIELIVAMAILAFIMTAVGTVMSSSMLSNRKVSADITVQTSAQQTYNQLSDSIMQATNIILLGYTSSADISFDVDEASVAGGLDRYYYVRDEEAKDAFIANSGSYLAPGDPLPNVTNVKYFSDLDPDDKIYVIRLYVDTSIDLDMSASSSTLMGSYYNVTDQFDPANPVQVSDEYTLTSDMVWDTKDTLRNIYTFNNGNMYYERKHRFASANDDVVSDWTDPDEAKKCIYNASLAVVYSGGDAATGTPVTGCVATVDSENGAMGFDLYFSDKNMTYTTLGMINTRNSFVLKGKKM